MPLASSQQEPNPSAYVAIDRDSLDDTENGALLRETGRSQTQTSRVWKLVRGRPGTVAALTALLLLGVWAVVDIAGKSGSSHQDLIPGSITSRNAAVSSENVICSEIGANTLRQGGSAVDATIATGLCIGVTNMYSSGIGGGGFMVVREKNGASKYVDFREEAPAASTRDMYVENPRSAQFGGLGVGIPGEIRGYEAAHKRYGKLPWRALFQPSIELSINGWTVSQTLESRIKAAGDLMLNNTAFRDVFAPNGQLLRKGDTIKREKLGATLKTIAEQGASVFYEGKIAESIVKTVTDDGGILTLNDMKQYQAKVQDTLIGYYHGRRIITSPAPTSGPVLLSVLNIMEGYDLRGEGRTPTNIHRLIESYKHGFAQRSYYGDPIDTVFRNITEIAEHFTDKQTAGLIRQNISDTKTFPPAYYNPPFDVEEDHGTMHVSVLGPDGEAVSMTCTVNLLFGGQLMDPETGIILNDEMDDFSIPGVPNAFGLVPSPYNYVQPRKRPLSSSVPTIIERDGQVEAIIGASGGSRIITATLQTIFDMLDWGLDAGHAVSMPRAHHQLLPNTIAVENEYDDALVKELEARGHNVTRLPPKFYLSGVEAIRRLRNGTIQAAGDWRKEGGAAGF
ncbi:gamma-glutamyltransferase [Spizellomyces punctatus DAOM BR117]|uniref:Glutathione hydrolase n=1 Tax=Spizellomyces punctatus (strain DAOM BR117) TaxID=645134 RepID=A0A0L0H9Z4_SPIPD|nr:gamma-glutamyltransferase [Spizellomyces punctatus DAOM BR117]KNC97483.1 gamma-glutamyltransferase [Spizellomyces punctatus DAOM BR117]|eukprot:XP_016605523.1 gamma-glutamyltransferase [Spizellomyces punctatus DAOM BR117]